MVKRKKNTEPSGGDRTPSPEILAALPSDRKALQARAPAIVASIHAAILENDLVRAGQAVEEYDAIVWRLNGDTFSSSYASDSSPGVQLERLCQAKPGNVPMWGQRGEFLVTRQGMRVWVKVDPDGDPLHTLFSLLAVDLDRPFLSETGYRAHFHRPKGGQDVLAAASGIVDEMLKNRRRSIEASSRDVLATETLPAWLAKAAPVPRRLPTALPAGFELVDVVLPSRQAFIVRKWAEQAMFSVAAASANPRDGQQLTAVRARAPRARRTRKDDL